MVVVTSMIRSISKSFHELVESEGCAVSFLFVSDLLDVSRLKDGSRNRNKTR